MHRLIPLALAVLCSLPFAAEAASPQAKDDTRTFDCLGEIVHRVFAFEVYRASYCLESDVAEKVIDRYLEAVRPDGDGASLERSLRDDPRFFRALAKAPGDKLVMFHLSRDVSRDQIAGALEKGLRSLLPEDKLGRLVAAVPGPGRKGQTAIIQTSGDRLWVRLGGETRTLEDPEIARAPWKAGMDPRKIKPDLRSSIAEYVSERVKPARSSEIPAPARSGRSAFGARRVGPGSRTLVMPGKAPFSR